MSSKIDQNDLPHHELQFSTKGNSKTRLITAVKNSVDGSAVPLPETLETDEGILAKKLILDFLLRDKNTLILRNENELERDKQFFYQIIGGTLENKESYRRIKKLYSMLLNIIKIYGSEIDTFNKLSYHSYSNKYFITANLKSGFQILFYESSNSGLFSAVERVKIQDDEHTDIDKRPRSVESFDKITISKKNGRPRGIVTVENKRYNLYGKIAYTRSFQVQNEIKGT